MTLDPNEELIDIDLSEAVYESVETITAPPKPRPKLSPELMERIRNTRLLRARDLADLPEPDWFIEDLLPYAPRTMVHGIGGSYKSFVVLDWVLCAATKQQWHGFNIRPGKTMYMAGEGMAGLAKRVLAWCTANGKTLEDLDDIDFMGDPINLSETRHTTVWQGFFDYTSYDYVVVDTLHMASAGSDENSSTDMGKVLENATHMVGPDTSLFYVHHDVISGAKHRGSSALRDDMDVVVGLSELKDTDLAAQMTADKIRDGESFRPINVFFEKYGEGKMSSLAVDRIVKDVKKVKVKSNKPPSAAERCADAITEHGLNYWRGEDYISQKLRDLDLGLRFSPATCGTALKKLRGASQQIADMKNRKDIELEDDDDD